MISHTELYAEKYPEYVKYDSDYFRLRPDRRDWRPIDVRECDDSEPSVSTGRSDISTGGGGRQRLFFCKHIVNTVNIKSTKILWFLKISAIITQHYISLHTF